MDAAKLRDKSYLLLAISTFGTATPMHASGMNTERRGMERWLNWTLKIKVWKALAALIIGLILFFWFRVVHQDDEILALVRNEVVTTDAGQRSWIGRFVNTNDRALTDVAVTVEFLDKQNRRVGRTDAHAPELRFGAQLDLQNALPPDAVKMRIYSVQWRMAGRPALMGPFREPWEFGYVMAGASVANR